VWNTLQGDRCIRQYKQWWSRNDCNRRFTDCFVGWPGSVHNARMFLNSKLGITMAESPMDVFSNETHILDDSAYLLLPHLLTPYKNTRRLTASQKNFNSIHSSTRNVVERAFGCMKSKFRRLEKIELNKLEDICQVMSTCVLHIASMKRSTTTKNTNTLFFRTMKITMFVLGHLVRM